MERIDMPLVVQDALARFSRNRTGDKPPVSLILTPGFPPVVWPDRGLKDFVRYFLYDCLLSCNPDAPIKIALRQRPLLNDLSTFLGIHASYWVHLQVSGRGIRIVERFIEELFADVGYRCNEWIGVEGSSAQLGIFGAIDAPARKLVFCIKATAARLSCELFVPVEQTEALPAPAPSNDVLTERSPERHGALISDN
jgi:hypothetical protein